MSQDNQVDLFRSFVKEMNEVLHANSDTKEGRDQKALLEQMFAAEERFRDLLLSTADGQEMYKKFVSFIIKFKKNILSARVYFRERQAYFTSNKLTNAFRDNKPELLHRFRINYLFADWIMKRYRGEKRRELRKAFNEMREVRAQLVENNLPLVINRAKMFWSKVPESHLQYMDHIQNCGEGLVNAIDKFVPPYKSVFRSVAIGRMTLNMMTEHNSTLIKLSPTERRILYRANSARHGKNLQDEGKIAEYVKESFKGATAEEISNLSSAASTMLNLEGNSKEEPGVIKTAASDSNVEKEVEDKFMSQDLREALEYLSVIERKIVRLKHGYR